MFGKGNEARGSDSCRDRGWLPETDERYVAAGFWRILTPLLAEPTSPMGRQQREIAAADLPAQLAFGEREFRQHHLPDALAAVPVRQLGLSFEPATRNDATIAAMILTVQASHGGAAKLVARIGHLAQLHWTQSVKEPSVPDAALALDFIQTEGPSLGESGARAFAAELVNRVPRIAGTQSFGQVMGRPRVRLVDASEGWEVVDIADAIAAASAIARERGIHLTCERLFQPLS